MNEQAQILQGEMTRKSGIINMKRQKTGNWFNSDNRMHRESRPRKTSDCKTNKGTRKRKWNWNWNRREVMVTGARSNK